MDDDPLQKLRHVNALNCSSKACKLWVDQGFLKNMRMNPIVEFDDATCVETLRHSHRTVLDVSFHHLHLESIRVTAKPENSVKDLEVVNALDCKKLLKVIVEGVDNLRELNLKGSHTGTSVRLSRCGFKKLPVTGICASFLELKKIKGLKSLHAGEFRLVEVYRSNVEHVGPDPANRQASCTVLRALYLTKLVCLRTVYLRPYINMTTLTMRICLELRMIDLTGLSYLRFVVLHHCRMLTELNLTRCTSLKKLVIHDCEKLAVLDVTGCPEAFVKRELKKWMLIGDGIIIVS